MAAMKTGVWILGDRLYDGQAALAARADCRTETPVVVIESLSFARDRPYHAQKLVLVWSAMRHFVATLVDGYDWVMQTNVLGMGTFADGGVLASKPYVASGNYINRMGDYCRACIYDPKQRTGPAACPFNVFYWDFLIRHEAKLRSQGRLALVLKHLDKLDRDARTALQVQGEAWWTAQS